MRISYWSSDVCSSDLVDATVVLEAVAGALAQLVHRPARMGHADHRHVEPAARDHRLQRGKDLLVGKVAGGAEEHECVGSGGVGSGSQAGRSEEHTSELQSLMRISYAVLCLKKKQQ